jgi:hypothetical protein
MTKSADNFEELFKQFVKDVMRTGFDKFTTNGSRQPMGMEDLFRLFEQFKKKYEQETTITVTEEPAKPRQDEMLYAREMEIGVLKERILELKDQIETLKKQVKDKDEIIELLKGQGQAKAALKKKNAPKKQGE